MKERMRINRIRYNNMHGGDAERRLDRSRSECQQGLLTMLGHKRAKRVSSRASLLPDIIDKLTPKGQLPSARDLAER